MRKYSTHSAQVINKFVEYVKTVSWCSAAQGTITDSRGGILTMEIRCKHIL